MKKLLCILLTEIVLLCSCFCICLCICSCSFTTAPPAESFSARASVRLGSLKIDADVNAEKHRLLTIKVNSPKELKGYCYSYKNSKLSLGYNNMRLSCDESCLPKTAFAQTTYNVLKTIGKENGVELLSADNSFSEYKGSCESGVFLLKCEKATGAIKQISIEELKFSAVFHDIRLSEN